MIFYLIGIDYKTVNPQIHEQAYRNRDKIVSYWQHANPNKAGVLITCNRIEIYGIADTYTEAQAFINSFKLNFKDEFKNAYIMYEKEAFRHGVRLTCGLESQLQGEYQILQQLESWINNEDFPIFLKDLWKQMIVLGKQIREESNLGEDVVNIAKLVFSELKRHIIFKKQTEILVIGTGKIATLIARKNPYLGNLAFVARKKRSKAQRLAKKTGGKALLPEDIPNYLMTVDAVICATSSPHYVLNIEDFDKALKVRKKPLYVYDLAMPPDVTPEVKTVPFVTVQNLNNIVSGAYVSKNYISERINLAEQLVDKNIHEEAINGRLYTSWH